MTRGKREAELEKTTSFSSFNKERRYEVKQYLTSEYSMPPTRTFRKPRFENIQDGLSERLLTFIRNCRQDVSLEFTDEGMGTTADNPDIDDDVREHEKERIRVDNNSVVTKMNEQAHADHNEGISMLEPHIAAFRKRMNEDVYSGAQNDDGDDDDSFLAHNIPPQLLRIVRFFPFKWVPLKRALLRPPSTVRVRMFSIRLFVLIISFPLRVLTIPLNALLVKNEIGKTTRLSLAKALHQKKLIASAEFDLLEQSFYKYVADDDINDTNETASSVSSSYTNSR